MSIKRLTKLIARNSRIGDELNDIAFIRFRFSARATIRQRTGMSSLDSLTIGCEKRHHVSIPAAGRRCREAPFDLPEQIARRAAKRRGGFLSCDAKYLADACIGMLRYSQSLRQSAL